MNNQEHAKDHGAQQELNRQFVNFLDNHWPTLEKAVGSVNGKVTVMMWALGAVLTSTVAVLVRLLFF